MKGWFGKDFSVDYSHLTLDDGQYYQGKCVRIGAKIPKNVIHLNNKEVLLYGKRRKNTMSGNMDYMLKVQIKFPDKAITQVACNRCDFNSFVCSGNRVKCVNKTTRVNGDAGS